MKNRQSLNRFASPHIVQPVVRPKIQPLNLANASNEQDSALDSLRLEATDNNQIIKTHQPIQTPRSELNDSKPLLHSVSSTSFDLDQLLFFDVHPLFSESPPEEHLNLFTKKCQQCSQMCDFRKDDEKEIQTAKEEMLNDILNGVSDMKLVAQLTKAEYSIFYKFFIKNVIRPTPLPPKMWAAPSTMDFAVDRVEEIGWSHMSLCYDIFYSFLSNRKFNFAHCKKEIFFIIHGIVPLFKSPDKREREKLMKIFHGMYRNLTKFRGKIQKEITCLLQDYKISNIPLGCLELLNSLVPVVQGYKVPLHQENVNFFINVIVPLHCCPQIQYFHNALLSVISAFLVKDPNMIVFVFENLSQHWPQTSPTKQIFFLNEIEGMTESLNTECTQKLAPLIAKLVAKSVSDSNFGVCEKALMLWESDTFMKLIANQAKTTFPILLPEIFKTATAHWCGDVRSLALNAMRVLKGCDLATFDSIGLKFKQIENEKIVKQIELGSMWNRLAEQHADPNDLQELKFKIGYIYIGFDRKYAESPKESPKMKPPGTPNKKINTKITPKASALSLKPQPSPGRRKGGRSSLCDTAP